MPSRARDLAALALAAAAVAAGARAARSGSVAAAESRCFAALNGLSPRPYLPVWTVMQLGSLGGALAAGAAVGALGRPALGRRLATVGTLAWLASKAVKPYVQRGRPGSVLAAARVLGREQAGLGYPSGHAGVAAALAAAASPHVAAPLRPPLWAAALGVGASRVYVGAHLPLDVAGGVALGLGAERAVRALRGRG